MIPVERVTWTQRNWSQVGRAVTPEGDFFVKRFVDARGRRHEKGFLGELASVASFADHGIDGVELVPVTWSDPETLTLAQPFRAMTTLDTQLREGTLTDAQIDDTATAGRLICEALAERGELVLGLDVRNLGWTGSGPVSWFDLGPTRPARPGEAGARWACSVLLLRWGRDLRVAARGPDPALTRRLTANIEVDRADAHRLLDELFRVRWDEPATGRVGTVVHRAVLTTLGRRYWRQAHRLLDEVC